MSKISLQCSNFSPVQNFISRVPRIGLVSFKDLCQIPKTNDRQRGLFYAQIPFVVSTRTLLSAEKVVFIVGFTNLGEAVVPGRSDNLTDAKKHRPN